MCQMFTAKDSTAKEAMTPPKISSLFFRICKLFHISQVYWVHRVYGMQKDRLDLKIILFEKLLKTMLCSQRYLQKKWRKSLNECRFAYHKPFKQNEWRLFPGFFIFADRFFKENKWKGLNIRPILAIEVL